MTEVFSLEKAQKQGMNYYRYQTPSKNKSKDSYRQNIYEVNSLTSILSWNCQLIASRKQLAIKRIIECFVLTWQSCNGR
jgi:hypothetical protein